MKTPLSHHRITIKSDKITINRWYVNVYQRVCEAVELRTSSQGEHMTNHSPAQESGGASKRQRQQTGGGSGAKGEERKPKHGHLYI